MSDYIEKLGKSNLLIEGSLMVGYLVSVFSKDMRNVCIFERAKYIYLNTVKTLITAAL